jgi:hypothetical protein
MTPILVLAIALAGYFFGAEAAQGEIVAQMQGLAGPNGAQAIQALLAAAQDPASGLMATILASVLLLVGATSVFAELKGSLDEMWGIRKFRRSSFGTLVRTRLLSFGLVLVLAFLLLISLVVSASLAVLERYAGGIWSSSGDVLSAISSRCLDRRHFHGGIVRSRKICDRALPGQQRRGLRFRRRRIGGRIAGLGLLLGADFLPGRGIHPAVRAVVRQPAARKAAPPGACAIGSIAHRSPRRSARGCERAR